ncbi:MAG: undecaprenyl/decaprenyl-phosphate alpha-N-acetylglucosaminyl 1-phosphate transferase [Elusimicrobia bacterium]|nr:undecaprenyl/decaprenyl-phosphate alpha-N-acetylglucosaminyl 1-phosphate transferase [Elusimicrobiota bacterium]
MISLYISMACASLGGVLMAVPVSLYLARRFQVVDIPDQRKVHTEPIPRWGGLAIAIGFFIGLAVLFIGSQRFGWLLDYRHRIIIDNELIGYLSIEKQLIGIMIGSLLVLGLGMWDDKFSIGPIPKLLTQIIAAYIAMDYGVRISGIDLPFNGRYFSFPLIVSQIVTVVWIIGFMNMINLVDGLDGLASGLVVIVAGTFLIIAVFQADATQVVLFSKQLKLAGILSAGLVGAVLAFLLFNFYPARIFMGDGGTLFLGFMLGAVTVIGTLKTAAVIAFIIPVIVVGIPAVDVVFALLRRWRGKRHLFKPDKDHIHHRLLKKGWTQREIVLLMYVITLLLSITAILITVVKTYG